jgi:two-component system KDP operon response regulator KdpE
MCQKVLEKENFEVQTILDPEDVPDILSEGFAEAVVLDSSMDEDDLPGLCKVISESLKIPVIVIGDIDHTARKIKYLESSDSIYIELPFNPDEFIAQVKALLRITGSGESRPDIPGFTSGDLRIDYHRRLVTVKGKEVSLSPHEYKILIVLTRNAGKVLTYAQLLHEVWGPEYQTERQYLHVYISFLRKKLKTGQKQPEYITNIPGVGYRFSLKEE